MIKHKLTLKREYVEDMYEIYPNAFYVKEVNTQKKITTNFIKLMKRNPETQKWIVKNLGMTYLWYLHLLTNTINYDNEVDFSELREIWVKEWMLKVVRKKLIDSNVVAKKGKRFYLNPMVAIKWETIDPEISNLFANNK